MTDSPGPRFPRGLVGSLEPVPPASARFRTPREGLFLFATVRTFRDGTAIRFEGSAADGPARPGLGRRPQALRPRWDVLVAMQRGLG